jgi:hypothetical protein
MLQTVMQTSHRDTLGGERMMSIPAPSGKCRVSTSLTLSCRIQGPEEPPNAPTRAEAAALAAPV